MADTVALLLDGGFVKKKLQAQLERFPRPGDVVAFCDHLMRKPRLAGKELFRVFYYDAPPHEGQAANPIDGSIVNFSETVQSKQNRALLDSLELEPDFAIRRGEVIQTGWKLGSSALRNLSSTQRPITAGDLVPNMAQKGVDLRIGLDIAWISLKRLIDVMVLVTGIPTSFPQ